MRCLELNDEVHQEVFEISRLCPPSGLRYLARFRRLNGRAVYDSKFLYYLMGLSVARFT